MHIPDDLEKLSDNELRALSNTILTGWEKQLEEGSQKALHDLVMRQKDVLNAIFALRNRRLYEEQQQMPEVVAQITPQEIKDWLHHADAETLARFVADHQDLIAQLLRAWRRQTGKEQAAHNPPDSLLPQEKEDSGQAAPGGNGGAEEAHDLPDAAESPLPGGEEGGEQTAVDNNETADTARITIASLSAVYPSADDEFAPLDAPTPEPAMPLHPAKPAPIAAQPLPIRLPPLPNANQGQPYTTTLPDDLPITGLTIEHAESGLAWDAGQRRIHGTPTVSGDLPIRLTLRDSDKEIATHLTLHINPDPKSLWQNKPSDQGAPFAKSDSAHDILPTPQGRLIAARQRGRSHAHIGSYCDDDYRIAYHAASGLHLIAVADGAGSASHARYGSQLVVEAVANTISGILDAATSYDKLTGLNADEREEVATKLITHALHAAHTAHFTAAKEHGLDPKSLSCTLLIGLSVPLPDGSWHHSAYQVGDGAAALWHAADSNLIPLGTADSGAYSGETQFFGRAQLEEADIARRIRHYSDIRPYNMILMTDGVSDPKFETDAGLAAPARWAELWQELQAPLVDAVPDTALLEWLDFWSRGNHDDRTIALFIPHDKERP